MKDVLVLTGAGQIGLAIAKRLGAGRKIVVGDVRMENAQAAAALLSNAGFDPEPVRMDLAERDSIRAMLDHALFRRHRHARQCGRRLANPSGGSEQLLNPCRSAPLRQALKNFFRAFRFPYD